MRPTLATMAPAALRMLLACYAHAHPADTRTGLVWARLGDHAWVPTPDDCPVPWEALHAWYDGLEQAAPPTQGVAGRTRQQEDA